MMEKLIQYAYTTEFSKNISIYKKEKVLLDKSLGYRDMANKLQNNEETIFGIAFGTKTFTVIGILRLIEKKVMTLSTTVTEIFKRDLGFIDPKATIKDLLVHTSGIFDYSDEEIISDFDNFFVSVPWYQLETPSDYLPLFDGKFPKFKSGSRVSYSNGGYVLLGIIIEKLTGQSYRDFMANEVFAQLGMLST